MYMRFCCLSILCSIISLGTLQGSASDSQVLQVKTPTCYIKRDASVGDLEQGDMPTSYVENAPCWYVYISLPERDPRPSDIDAAITWLRSQGVEDDFIYEYIFYEIEKRCERGDYSIEQGCDLMYYIRELGIDTYHNMITHLDESTITQAINYMHALRVPHEIRLHKIKHDIRSLYVSGVYDQETACAWFQYAENYECRSDLQELLQGMKQCAQESSQ